ncbi:hypothetical protein KCU78_g4922, partial [Aureobasidium melanogenum]
MFPRVHSGLAVASMVAAAAALSSNGTTETVTVTRTSWSTLLSCPSPTTVTVCNAQCPTSSGYVNSANVVYQTISDCQAGDVVNIAGTLTTLAEPTVLTVEETISNLVLVPDAATDSNLTAAATVTTVVYSSSVTGNSGQVVTCQTGVTTLGHDGVVLTDYPCTVQSTVLELTATGSGAMPTAMVSSSNYIVKIIYVYVIETIIEQVPTTITTTATNILTTTSAEAAASANSALPTIVNVDQVTFLLQYNTTYDGVPDTGLRKRQAFGSPSIPAALNDCLTRCAEQTDCRAASFAASTSACVPLRQFDAQSRRVSPSEIFAIVIFRPSAPTGSSLSSNVVALSSLTALTDLVSSSSSGISPSLVESQSLTPSSSRSSTSFETSSSAGTDSTSVSPTSKSSNQISSSSAKYPMSNTSISSTSLSSRSSSSSRLPVPVTSSSVISISSESSLSTSSGSSLSFSSGSSSSMSLSSSGFMTQISNTSTNVILSPTTSSPIVSSSSSASSTSLAPLTGCAVASELLGYAPAASYCSSAYPVTTYTSLFNATITDTVTDTGVASTFYGNVTLPAETTVQTIEETVTQTSFFPVEATETDTTTTTTTVSNTPAALQRRRPSAASAASIFTSILSRPASDIALVCSCLQTPVTDSVTSTVTILSTTTSTPIISANMTFTPPTMTLQTTETNTETIDVTTTTATTTTTEVVTVLIVSVTSSYESTYTTIQPTPTTDIVTITTCTVGTVSPVGSCQNTVYSTAGRYYSEQCDNPVVSGSTRINVYGANDVNSCARFCAQFSSSCNLVIYNPTSSPCYLVVTTPGSGTTFTGVQAVAVYTTNPCVATVTSIGTAYSTETITSQIVTVFESTVTSSPTST